MVENILVNSRTILKMAKALSPGLMVVAMMATGLKVNNMALEERLMPKVIFIRESGKTINSMVKALTNIQMETLMKATGSKTSNMVMVLRTGLMDQCMVVNMLTA